MRSSSSTGRRTGSGSGSALAGLRIRPLQPGDVVATHAIYAREVVDGTASWEWEPPSLEEWRARTVDLRAAGFPYLVAEQAGVVVGFAHASSYRARAGYAWCVENSVYVDPAARRLGIARALMAQLIADCAAVGFRQMIAVVGDSRNEASIRLHETMGFTRVGVFPGIGYKHGRWLDSVQLVRALGSGAAAAPGDLAGRLRPPDARNT